MTDEVRYHMLRPKQIVERRNEYPIAYIPIGNIEWHGVHNPVGADTLQAEGIAIQCARKGGLSFPPLYYGDSRAEALVEASPAKGEQIAEEMGLQKECFDPANMPFSPMEQILNYNKLLIHILSEVESLGFNVGVLVAGHYPLIDHARAAVLQFNQRRLNRFNRMLAWAFCDYLLVEHMYDRPGDHAGGWETSHMLALHPETVDLSLLPPRNVKATGVSGTRLPHDATAEFGRETMDRAVEIAVKEAHHRLMNPRQYTRNGSCLKEGLWK